ncbi:lantibiotic dehydratase [Streptomyces sp. NPDC020362]|uniref:lantibiotic dehydratase n=1 Tax=unclassified Streptomyces TaxID=2593676 RepID=UPI00340E4F57
MALPHHVRLGDSEWLIWRDALLRSTGFPASGLERFAAPDCVAAADAHLAGDADHETFLEAFRVAVALTSTEVNRVAANPRLREAIAWQSPAIVTLLDSLLRNQEPIRRNAKRRYREEQLSRFWQRYCAKTETIGFFGPSLWISLDPTSPDSVVTVGDRLTDGRRVFLEPWAVLAYGDLLARDPEIRPWLPPARQPHHRLDGRQLHRPGLPSVAVSATEAEILAASDGSRPASHIAEALVATDVPDLEQPADVYAAMARLAERKLLTWNAHLPLDTTAESVLEARIAAIGDPAARERAALGLRRLTDARDKVAAAADDADALPAALRLLAEEFTALTGCEPRRHSGAVYAGRGLCYEDTTRDLRLTLGRRFLDELAPPMAIVLQAARWLTAALAQAYERELLHVYAQASGNGEGVTLGDVWYKALSLFMGSGPSPAQAVLDEFADRWARLLDLPVDTREVRELRWAASDLSKQVEEVFPADRPGWSAARLHSPDLQICARSLQAVNEGDYRVVLGELHAAVPTMEGQLFSWARADPQWVTEQATQDYGVRRVMPLFPAVWPRNAGRLVPFERAGSDHFLGFAPAPGADLTRTTPVSGIPVMLRDGALTVSVDGRELPLTEVFSAFLSTIAADAFKLVAPAEHTPRLVIDQLVVVRETWRTTCEATDLTKVRDEAGEFLAARRWRSRLGLPERCFVKIATEAKPLYVDFTSPLYVSALCASLRAALKRQNGDVALTVTEMLPDPAEAWVPGPDGEGYFGELRFHITDPRPAAAAVASPTLEKTR